MSNGKTFPDTFGGRVVVRDLAKAEDLVARAEKGRPLVEEDEKPLSFKVPAAFHKAIKLEATRRGISIRSLILDALHAAGIRE